MIVCIPFQVILSTESLRVLLAGNPLVLGVYVLVLDSGVVRLEYGAPALCLATGAVSQSLYCC